MQDRLLLKWGTLKGYELESEGSREALRMYAEAGPISANGAMTQRDTPEQKEALCALIDAIEGTIRNDWSGDIMTKDEAKTYVREYGAKS